MKSFLLIGLGRFGRHLAMQLNAQGHQVMAVDDDEEKVNAVLNVVTNAQIGDSTNGEFLQELGVGNYDVCIVAISDNFQSSLETTSLLKELGAKKVVSRAERDVQAKFLLRNGADEVVYPERDSAERMATRLSAQNVFDYIELTDEYSIYEIAPLENWVGHSIREVDVRNKYHINILGVKEGGELKPLPGGDYRFTGNEHLLAMAAREDAKKLLRKM